MATGRRTCGCLPRQTESAIWNSSNSIRPFSISPVRWAPGSPEAKPAAKGPTSSIDRLSLYGETIDPLRRLARRDIVSQCDSLPKMDKTRHTFVYWTFAPGRRAVRRAFPGIRQCARVRPRFLQRSGFPFAGVLHDRRPDDPIQGGAFVAPRFVGRRRSQLGVICAGPIGWDETACWKASRGLAGRCRCVAFLALNQPDTFAAVPAQIGVARATTGRRARPGRVASHSLTSLMGRDVGGIKRNAGKKRVSGRPDELLGPLRFRPRLLQIYTAVGNCKTCSWSPN